MAVGLMGSEDPADSIFSDSKGSSLPKVPQFGRQNPSYRGAEISVLMAGFSILGFLCFSVFFSGFSVLF